MDRKPISRFDHRNARPRGRVARALALAIAAVLHAAPASAQSQPQSRGELLYTTNCITCHTEQVHWRDRKLVRDWNSLSEQVRRWQDVASLGWQDEDILAVAVYLNERYYGFEPASRTGSLRTLAPAPSSARGSEGRLRVDGDGVARAP